MKYNDPLIIRENDSLSLLLKHIKKGSIVLEFGCANGRMTKYMKESLGCQVYIVEYEKEAFDSAIHFAQHGLCDDIMNYTWLEEFNDVRFDYIIFADVLEHLYDPQAVLARTKELLDDSGLLLISVPNICHNDIIAQLYMNSFVYTDIGLLDDTHIRFFSDNTLAEFCEGAGYKIIQRDYVTLESGTTEQLRDCKEKPNSLLWNILLSRAKGDVYQIIAILKKGTVASNDKEEIKRIIYPRIEGKLYFDRGDGFIEDDKEVVYAIGEGDGSYTFEKSISMDNVLAIRYDPCEGQGCIIEFFDDNEQDVTFSSNILQGNKLLLLDDDPKVIFKLINKDIAQLTIKVKFCVRGECYLRLLEEMILKYSDKELALKKINDEEIDKKNLQINELNISLERLNKEKLAGFELREKELGKVKAELNDILESRSWRWTKVFRCLKSKVKRGSTRRRNL